MRIKKLAKRFKFEVASADSNRKDSCDLLMTILCTNIASLTRNATITLVSKDKFAMTVVENYKKHVAMRVIELLVIS